jgi:hypothetical protein
MQIRVVHKDHFGPPYIPKPLYVKIDIKTYEYALNSILPLVYPDTKKEGKVSERLEHMMGEMANEINADLKQYVGEVDLLQSDGSVRMEAFVSKKPVNGPYKKDGGPDSVKADKNLVRELELKWSGVMKENGEIDEKIFNRYKQDPNYKPRIQTLDDIIALRKKNKNETPSGKLEMAITGLLYKFLKDDFIVMRASEYDDRANGADNVIVNRHTGDVVCAFDEVHDEEGGERHNGKLAKVAKNAEKGGTTIKYGFTFEKDATTNQTTLVRKAIEHVPSFYLGLAPDELAELLEHMQFDIHAGVNKVELKILDKLISSLEEQVDGLKNNRRVHRGVQKSVQNFEASLERMKELRTKVKVT